MRVIVVEDNILFCDYICNFLQNADYQTVKAYRLAQARQVIARSVREDDIVLADLRLPDGESTALLEWMREQGYTRTLLERKYIRYSGKYVIPTPKGLFFYETVRGMKIADASLTSGWEAELAQIERGERTPEEFLDGVLELVKGITGEIRRIQRPEE